MHLIRDYICVCACVQACACVHTHMFILGPSKVYFDKRELFYDKMKK